MKNDKNNILVGQSLPECEEFALSIGERKYRGRQLYKWIYEKRVRTFDEMTDVPLGLRKKLAQNAQLGWLELADKNHSLESASIKYLFRLIDGSFIESVLIIEGARRTLCISSQVGCALDCHFCATGKLGFKRNLTAGEIVDQVLFVADDQDALPTNVVFMGMGEPFYNYDNVINAAFLITDDNGISIGPRHVVISTAGIVDRIHQYTRERHKYKLAVSLNSPFEEERKQLMPGTRLWSLDDLIVAVQKYARVMKRKPTIEYVLFQGLNDTERHARALRNIVNRMPCKMNLIPYNPVVPDYHRPTTESVGMFMNWLHPLNCGLSVRWSKGTDINAACGQLAGSRKKEEAERAV